MGRRRGAGGRMRVTLFTDTLGDVNGVCRFVQNMAEAAKSTGRDLQVVTSTRFATPAWPNIFNFAPIAAAKIPRYENLELCLPPLGRIRRHVVRFRPDVVHVSTPGPVGFAGRRAARSLGVPLLGVYHTDFPAYLDHLFGVRALTRTTAGFMRAFYKPFAAIFTRSADYAESIVNLGIPRERILRLKPGVDTSLFDARFRDPRLWEGFPGIDASSVKVLYVGRVSVEKNLPLLCAAWKDARARLGASPSAESGALHKAELLVVGDGPYRARMEQELAGHGAHFLGFRHGPELSALYASSDLFVFPSATDTLGQVVMESQASGLPVLVSDRGGPKEVVREGETGFVLPADAPSVWAERIGALVTDSQKRRRMGQAAHLAMQEMSIVRTFEDFWGVHERVLREARRVGATRVEGTHEGGARGRAQRC